jgi:hypothetical protein
VSWVAYPGALAFDPAAPSSLRPGIGQFHAEKRKEMDKAHGAGKELQITPL